MLHSYKMWVGKLEVKGQVATPPSDYLTNQMTDSMGQSPSWAASQDISHILRNDKCSLPLTQEAVTWLCNDAWIKEHS